MAKHTPAPWAIEGYRQNHKAGGFWEAAIEGRNNGVAHIATVQGRHATEEAFQEVRANAMLIAAAPDLLAVLSELVESPNAKQNDLWDRARAIVAKARP